MAGKIIILCAIAAIAQLAICCPTNRLTTPYGLPRGNCGCGYNAGYGVAGTAYGVASTGGALPIGSVSSSAPLGLRVRSENSYQGTANVCGSLPFVGTVGLKGVLPTAGAGVVSYGCGNGAVGIAVEEGAATGIANAGYGAAVPGYGVAVPGYAVEVAGYNPVVAGYSCGCKRY